MTPKTALILIDIQNDYFDGGSNPLKGSLEASLEAKKILELFRDKNNLVIHVQHFSVRQGATFFIPGTRGIEIHSNVQPLTSEKVIIKNFPNSFRETELLKFLKENFVTNLVMCGMMTHMCVDATVRAAKDLGFECTLIADACATKDLTIMEKTMKAADVHFSFLAAMSYFYANVLTSKDYLQRI